MDFRDRSARIFHGRHSVQEELEWLDSQGPTSPSLMRRLKRVADECDFVILFSARYSPAFHGARFASHKAVLVPTAEREAGLGLEIFKPVFRGVRGIMYNSFEEQSTHHDAVVQRPRARYRSSALGRGFHEHVDPDRARQKFGLNNPFIVYVGRIDANKGCEDLFRYFREYADRSSHALDLVLIGTPVLTIPSHPRIRHLGFVADQDKFDTIAAADTLVMPSPYESLSMVALEAWALGRPVLASARCDVLVGQCLRSNAGLYYDDAQEFGAALDLILSDRSLAATLGSNGRRFYDRNYSWPVIERTYLNMLDGLRQTPPVHRMEPLPGWFARRARTAPPAADVVNALPKGPVVTADQQSDVRRHQPQRLESR